ncbi:glycosyltransferase family protein [Paenibacillus tyrfis]|uniref:glycosyltransferase family protein n=1 Tax=Paenibacillus tyrfis TaxID=1501230 RepID=UPI0007C5C672|nr:glycosyltransferase family protein [Paenibacillus tyrfis]
MNEYKVCFITCYNDEVLYQECLKYIHTLKVPEGFEIEILGIVGAESMAAGYNKAMQSSDAKYKVYLHQDTFIINKDFILDIIKLFSLNPLIGIMGVAGAEYLPLKGVWWEARSKYGAVFESSTGVLKKLEFNNEIDNYKSVTVVDGLILITQYDLPWREDLFEGWHCYDLSQCMEFIKNGYEVAIPRQDKYWCIHDCGIVNVSNGFEDNLKITLQNYSEIIIDRYKLYLDQTINHLDDELQKRKKEENNEYEKLLLIKEMLHVEYEGMI